MEIVLYKLVTKIINYILNSLKYLNIWFENPSVTLSEINIALYNK